MKASVTIEGDRELQRQFEKIKKQSPEKLRGLLFAGAESTRTEAVTSINSSQSQGREYRRGNVTHIASTAGNPPNTDRGDLVRNITTEPIQGGFDVGSRASAPHGLWLEFGTLKIAPRPWLTPAYKKAVNVVRNLLKDTKL